MECGIGALMPELLVCACAAANYSHGPDLPAPVAGRVHFHLYGGGRRKFGISRWSYCGDGIVIRILMLVAPLSLGATAPASSVEHEQRVDLYELQRV
jgi:hypothetical protein